MALLTLNYSRIALGSISQRQAHMKIRMHRIPKTIKPQSGDPLIYKYQIISYTGNTVSRHSMLKPEAPPGDSDCNLKPFSFY